MIGWAGADGHGLTGSSTSSTSSSRASAARAQRDRRQGKPISVDDRQGDGARQEPRADDLGAAAVGGRAGAGRRRRAVPARREPPRSSPTRRPTRFSRSQTGRRSTRTRPSSAWSAGRRPCAGRRGPGRGHVVRAGLDLQGDHRRRRSAGRHGDARHADLRYPVRTSMPYGNKISDAEPHGDETLSVAADPRVSSNIGADRDRPEARHDTASRYWVNRFGFGKPTGVSLAGRAERASCRPLAQYSGVSMYNLPFGQGRVGHADADGPGLRRDRQWRRPAHARRSSTRSAARRSLSRRASGSSPTTSPTNCATCCAACWPTAAPPPAPRSPDTTWRARPAPPGRRQRQVLQQRLHRLVHRHGARQQPETGGRRGRQRPEERHLRRLGCGACLPEDRRLGGAALRHQSVPVAVPALGVNPATPSTP